MVKARKQKEIPCASYEWYLSSYKETDYESFWEIQIIYLSHLFDESAGLFLESK